MGDMGVGPGGMRRQPGVVMTLLTCSMDVQ